MTTSLTVAQARAGILADAIRDANPPISTIDQIASLPRVAGWRATIIAAAIADLIADGRLTATRGAPIVKPRDGSA